MSVLVGVCVRVVLVVVCVQVINVSLGRCATSSDIVATMFRSNQPSFPPWDGKMTITGFSCILESFGFFPGFPGPGKSWKVSLILEIKA